MKRTHTCGELKKKDVNKEVFLDGWVQSRRDHGGVIFIDLRDRYGLTQVVFDPSSNKEVHVVAEKIRREFVLRVKGKVRPRKEGMINPNMATGEVEVICDELEILNEADVPPLEVDDRKISNEDIRLKYRYLDLRRPSMQQNLMIRHKIAKATRELFDSLNFLEIETPMLIRATPEGARDYIVPSRVNPGMIYSLPQSPQLYKQLLMVSGMDRYYQLARCLRDEDLRADRQPEFTQIDLEMSFIEQEDIFEVLDKLMHHIMKKVKGIDMKISFPRITYEESMSKYGNDKPDTRFGLELVDVSEIAKNSEFSVFQSAVSSGGCVKCVNVKGKADFSRKKIDELEAFVQIYKAKGLIWLKMDKELEGSITKFLTKEQQKGIIEKTKTEKGDLLVFVAGKKKIVNDALGQLRNHLGKELKLYKEETYNFLWVVDFPLFEWNEEQENWTPAHHMFTMPKKDSLKHLETEPGKVIAQCYDLVLNGVELGSGSIRCHRADIQNRVMAAMGIKREEAERRFGFLLEAFKYGAPPHGGFAVGLDRLVAILCGVPEHDIREVMAFPKNKAAQCPMDGCPSQAADSELKEVHLKWNIVKKE
ncbi:aspartate--tRNA ligase [Candidatus Woesearchaeota archaeon]|nr:aspartate--tRNA ligase [Candidatus Woesearchaeota archaeon]